MTSNNIEAAGAEPGARPGGLMARLSAWHGRHPILAILLVSLMAVVINCHPVIFLGRSYVSPLTVNGWLVYDRWPPLPGMKAVGAPIEPSHGSDTAAEMWWGVPAGAIESRDILSEGELPLWNRYGHGGDVFLGQGISMLGDPLQLIVILGHGSAWAWDSKFLGAKFLFCVGFGWLVLRLVGSRPLSLAFAALGAYCGAYFYIHNHPAFFVLTYAPWILLSAIELLDLQSGKAMRWGLVWLLANFSCFNAGHVEMAVVLIGGLNLAATLQALIRYRGLGSAVKAVGRMGVATLLFLGLTAPIWMTFLATLAHAQTAHDTVAVTQLPITNLPGLFDDLFYLLLRDGEFNTAFAPGASLLILSGCAISAWRWRQLKGEPLFWVNSGAIVFWGGCIFGWVPAAVLRVIPLLNRVGHNDVDFSYLLIIHLTVQCAYGFGCLRKVETLRQAAGDFLFVLGVFAGMVLLYCSGHPKTYQPIPWNYFLYAAIGAIGAPLLFVFLKGRRKPIPVVGWVGIIILGLIPNFRFGLYADGNFMLLMLPGQRAALNLPSEAVDKIKAGETDAFRVTGEGHVFIGDYAAVYGLEDIRSCAPLWNGDYLELLRNFPGFHFSGDWMLELTDPGKAQPLLNLLNVKYVLVDPAWDTPTNFDGQVTDHSDFLVMKNAEAWPRAFFSHRVVQSDSNAAFIGYLEAHGREPFVAVSGETIQETAGLLQLQTEKEAEVTSATNYKLRPNSTAFDIHVPASGVVCLTEGIGRDFIATANGEAKDIFTVNRAFKGIYVHESGDYHIEFRYCPRHWGVACGWFWISFLIAVGVGGVEWLRERRITKV